VYLLQEIPLKAPGGGGGVEEGTINFDYHQSILLIAVTGEFLSSQSIKELHVIIKFLLLPDLSD
jgi:hypothetical protein